MRSSTHRPSERVVNETTFRSLEIYRSVTASILSDANICERYEVTAWARRNALPAHKFYGSRFRYSLKKSDRQILFSTKSESLLLPLVARED